MKFTYDTTLMLSIPCPFRKSEHHNPMVGSYTCVSGCRWFQKRTETLPFIYELVCGCGVTQPNILINPPENPVTMLF